MNEQHKKYLFNIGFMLAAGLVASSLILAWAYTSGKKGEESITVTGAAKKRITSDLVEWNASVSYRAPELSIAYKSLSTNVPKIKEYLIKKGVKEDEITISAISSRTLNRRDENGNMTDEIAGYSLSQSVEVKSGNVKLISKIAREATELINQGILIDSSPPRYYYTKLSDLKIEMLGEAAKNARMRAEQIAASTGNSIGKIKSARMGVMQITAADSTEVSDYGISDTSSIEKDLTAVVNANFTVY